MSLCLLDCPRGPYVTYVAHTARLNGSATAAQTESRPSAAMDETITHVASKDTAGKCEHVRPK